MSSVPLGVILFAVSVHASPDSPGGLSVNVPATAAATGGGLVVWAVTELAREELIPRTCRWCEPPAFDRHVRAQVVWSDPKVAGLLSDVLQLVVPASLAGADLLFARDLGRASEDVLVSVEAIVFAAVATQAAKFAFARRNPAAWAAGARSSPDDDRAFLSGHVATSFAAAAAFGTVARLRGYRHWPAVYAVGFSGAAAIGYLRMAADEHWLSDVVASATAGAALGMAVPLLLHRSDQQPRLTVPAGPAAGGGIALRQTSFRKVTLPVASKALTRSTRALAASQGALPHLDPVYRRATANQGANLKAFDDAFLGKTPQEVQAKRAQLRDLIRRRFAQQPNLAAAAEKKLDELLQTRTRQAAATSSPPPR